MLVSAVPPVILKTDDNPGGPPIKTFDGIGAGSIADRAQLYRDLADGPYFGNEDRPAFVQGAAEGATSSVTAGTA